MKFSYQLFKSNRTHNILATILLWISFFSKIFLFQNKLPRPTIKSETPQTKRTRKTKPKKEDDEDFTPAKSEINPKVTRARNEALKLKI